ncbi:MAG: hypothetical protein P8N50_02805 [Actinomycetota bacterium]|nr:hypothetical protein [Actinomycetota bacterium]
MRSGPAARCRFRVTLVLVAFLGVLAGACGSESSTIGAEGSDVRQSPTLVAEVGSSSTAADEPAVSPDTAAATTIPATTAPEPDVSNYPIFTSITSGGVAFDSLDYAGQDVLLWFWAPW